MIQSDNVHGEHRNEQQHNLSGGLSSAEVKQLLAQYGYNELPEKKVNLALKILTYFNGPIPWMMRSFSVGLLDCLVACQRPR